MLSREDLFKVYSYCSAVWSNFKTPGEDEDLQGHIFDLTWYDILSPYNLDIIFLAIKEYAKESDFCNIAKVGEMCKKIQKISEGKYINEEDVLSEIRIAIMQCIKKEAYENLSDFAKEVVGGAWQLTKWSMLTTNEVETVIMSNLRKKIKELKNKENDKNIYYELQAINHFTNQMLEENFSGGNIKKIVKSN